MKKLILLSLAVCFLCSCETLFLALSDDGPATFRVVGDKAFVNGTLGKKASKAFDRMVEKHPGVKTLVLQQVPGSISDEWNIPMCIKVHERGMNTALEANSEIASGAVDLFVAGHRRTAERGARVGVHSWRDLKKDGSEYPKDHEGHKIFLDYFDAINRSFDFYWFTLEAASAKNIHWMTLSEIDEYGLVTEWKK